MYRNHFNMMDDEEPEDRPVLPSISRIFDNSSSRTSTSLRLPPLPTSGQDQQAMAVRQTIRSDTWPPPPVPHNQQDYSSRSVAQMPNYPATMMNFPRDPHISALETNQTMAALASARSASTRQYPTDPYGDPSHNRERAYNSLPAGRPGAMHDHHISTGHTGTHHTVGNVRDFSSNFSLQSRPMYDQRSMDNPSSARHQCNYCGKRFSRPSGLKIHITTHTGERPYVCPVEDCHRSFSVRSNMRRHVRGVHQSLSTFEGMTDSSEDGDSRDSREEE
ncbi:hypothetical protein J3R30DRAFT_3448881 [Lentinula aciculospora]|uniref:C2H2-type domain-containing protein n=1 Tax=Lentinula aciculospora TaxID=153920 RepID=A0A9W9DS40_9AGAR|nr:hypothetical protein J3R30DRAFT_3448881 [Lentinula aciculospora]